MIKPTVGRVAWYFHGYHGPQAAIICHVHDDRLVNLMVISEQGGTQGMTSVPLLQDDDAPLSPGTCYCCWMPYQKGQAAKVEQLEKQLAQP